MITEEQRRIIAEAAEVPAQLLEEAFAACQNGIHEGEPWFPYAPGSRADPVKFFPGCLARAWTALQAAALDEHQKEQMKAHGVEEPQTTIHPIRKDTAGPLRNVSDYCQCFTLRMNQGTPFPPPVGFVAPRPLPLPTPANTAPDAPEAPTEPQTDPEQAGTPPEPEPFALLL